MPDFGAQMTTQYPCPAELAVDYRLTAGCATDSVPRILHTAFGHQTFPNGTSKASKLDISSLKSSISKPQHHLTFSITVPVRHPPSPHHPPNTQNTKHHPEQWNPPNLTPTQRQPPSPQTPPPPNHAPTLPTSTTTSSPSSSAPPSPSSSSQP